jgi:nitrile hydratase
LLIEKGILRAGELRRQVEDMDRRNPQAGARLVARAWVDPAFKARALADGSAAAAELGIDIGPTHLVVVENTSEVHNLVVCTLCSCYPRMLLGLPREVLREFGTAISDAVAVRVHDSTADMRYIVLPRQPDGCEHLSEAELAGLVTRDAMIGVAIVERPD